MTAPSGGFAPQASGGESRFMTARVRLTGFGPGHTTGREGGGRTQAASGGLHVPPDSLIGQKKTDVNGYLGIRAASRSCADPAAREEGVGKKPFF